MNERFLRALESLDQVFAFTESFFAAEQVDGNHRYAINLVIEELFSNMVKYNPSSTAEIRMDMERRPDEVQVRISDHEEAPFDVTAPREVDTGAPLEQRQAGGLGLFLVQKFVDSLDYAYRDGISTITFTRRLDSRHAED
jgi:anti-sigma regulatory factor (Ser/Thr protein kinase)